MRVSLPLLLVSATAVAPVMGVNVHSNMLRAIRRATPDYQADAPPAYGATDSSTTSASASAATATIAKRLDRMSHRVLKPPIPYAAVTPVSTTAASSASSASATAPATPGAAYATSASAPAPAAASAASSAAPAMSGKAEMQAAKKPVSEIPTSKASRGDELARALGSLGTAKHTGTTKRDEARALVRRTLGELERLGVVVREKIDYEASPDHDDSTHLHVLDASSPSAPSAPDVPAKESVKPAA